MVGRVGLCCGRAAALCCFWLATPTRRRSFAVGGRVGRRAGDGVQGAGVDQVGGSRRLGDGQQQRAGGGFRRCCRRRRRRRRRLAAAAARAPRRPERLDLRLRQRHGDQVNRRGVRKVGLARHQLGQLGEHGARLAHKPRRVGRRRRHKLAERQPSRLLLELVRLSADHALRERGLLVTSSLVNAKTCHTREAVEKVVGAAVVAAAVCDERAAEPGGDRAGDGGGRDRGGAGHLARVADEGGARGLGGHGGGGARRGGRGDGRGGGGWGRRGGGAAGCRGRAPQRRRAQHDKEGRPLQAHRCSSPSHTPTRSLAACLTPSRSHIIITPSALSRDTHKKSIGA